MPDEHRMHQMRRLLRGARHLHAGETAGRALRAPSPGQPVRRLREPAADLPRLPGRLAVRAGGGRDAARAGGEVPARLRAAGAVPVTFEELKELLFVRGNFGMKLGLDAMREALLQLGNPERATPAVHVAGTNGK